MRRCRNGATLPGGREHDSRRHGLRRKRIRRIEDGERRYRPARDRRDTRGAFLRRRPEDGDAERRATSPEFEAIVGGLGSRDVRRRAGGGAPAPGTQVDRDPRARALDHRVARARTRQPRTDEPQPREQGPPAADRPRVDRNVATHNSVAFLDGGGEMGARMRAYDWTATPLGPPHAWPQSLQTVVRIMLDSRYAMWMLWGPELTFFCNDAYLPTRRHQARLGARRALATRCGRRSGRTSARASSTCCATGQATWDEGLLLFLERSGYPEETYHTFSYSPVYDDDGAVARHALRRHRGHRARDRRAAHRAAGAIWRRHSASTKTGGEVLRASSSVTSARSRTTCRAR